MIELKETKSNSSGDDNGRSATRESGRICNESQKWMDEIQIEAGYKYFNYD
jgi:hypothetical protein